VIVVVSYYLVAHNQPAFAIWGSQRQRLWPSNSILVAALLLTPVRRWWMYLLAVVPAHILVHSAYHIGRCG